MSDVCSELQLMLYLSECDTKWQFWLLQCGSWTLLVLPTGVLQLVTSNSMLFGASSRLNMVPPDFSFRTGLPSVTQR